MKKKIVVLSGAGISAESGISTFRDSDGLWENHNVEDVASIDGWYRNPKLIIDFYNERRAQLEHCEPNAAHKLVAKLEEQYDVTVVTQNVDNLHERGGSYDCTLFYVNIVSRTTQVAASPNRYTGNDSTIVGETSARCDLNIINSSIRRNCPSATGRDLASGNNPAGR